jgi:hypothetical protein
MGVIIIISTGSKAPEQRYKAFAEAEFLMSNLPYNPYTQG